MIKNSFIILLFYLICSNAYAGDCGVTLPNAPPTNFGVLSPEDAQQHSAYDYLKDKINVDDPAQDCNLENEKIQFCLSAEDDCTKISIGPGVNVSLSSLSSYPEISNNQYLRSIVLSWEKIGSAACVMMPSSYGPMPILCRNAVISESQEIEEKCRIISDKCSKASNNSKVEMGFSGKMIDCVTHSLDKIFYQYSECDIDEDTTLLSGFPFFQENMKAIIRAALILYVMFFGFNVITQREEFTLSIVSGFIFKFLLVSYFSVGLGPVLFIGDSEVTSNGVTDFFLPIMKNFIQNFVQMVLSATSSAEGLCSFDPSLYDDDLKFYAIWDSIDCRIGRYFGFSISNTNSFGYLSMIFQVLFSSNFIIAIAMIVFAVLFIAMVVFFISHYLVCLITLYVMAYISPIFVPMALFDKTKKYFESWLKISISCAIQPMIVAGFIVIMLSIYDSAMYQDCQFSKNEQGDFISFEIVAPGSDGNECKKSVGYVLEQYFSGRESPTTKSFLLFSVDIVNLLHMTKSIIYLMIVSLILFYFCQNIAYFAAVVTYGPSMGMISLSPRQTALAGGKFVYSASKNAAKALKSIKGG